MIYRLWFVLLLLLLTLIAYGQRPGAQTAPRIEQLSASSSKLTSGEPVTLTWRLSGQPSVTSLMPEVGEVAGASVTLRPELSTTYTLLAQNRRGSDQKDVTVQVVAATPPGAGTGGTGNEDTEAPRGSFGVSRTPQGPFTNDSGDTIEGPADARIVRVSPGGEFFAEVLYRDPSGIADIELRLVNSSPPGLAGALEPQRGPFTLVGEPSGNCNLAEQPTQARCVYRIQVASDAQNITALEGAGDEFAYVLRTQVTDGAGNTAARPVRGYVIVTSLR